MPKSNGRKIAKRPPGRPTQFRREYVELAYNYCLLGATDAQLAESFGVSKQTLNTWKKAHPEFLDSLKTGREKADAEVAKSLFHRAKGYTHPEEKIFCSDGQVTRVKTLKHYPPDTAACIFWSKNRRPDLWRESPNPARGVQVIINTDLRPRPPQSSGNYVIELTPESDDAGDRPNGK